jgi:ABC-type multidrug transport system fused ATPase/permease subunit
MLSKILHFPIYFHRYVGYRLLLIIAICLLIGVLDSFGLAMFLPLLQVVDTNGKVNTDALGDFSLLIDSFAAIGLELNLLNILGLILVFFTLKGIVIYFGNSYKVKTQQFFVKTIRLNLLDLLASFRYQTFLSTDPGTIQNTMSGEVARLSLSLSYYLSIVQYVIIGLVYIVFALLINLKFALIIAIGGGLTNFLFSRVYSYTKKESKYLTGHANVYQGLLIQLITNFKYLKATARIYKYKETLAAKVLDLERSNGRIGKLNAFVTAIREPVIILVVVLAILVEVLYYSNPISSLLVSLLFFYRSLTAFMSVQNFYNQFLGTSGSMENMTEFQNVLSKHQDNPEIIENRGLIDKIEIKNGSLKFGEVEVIKDLFLEIKSKKVIALIGESGSGKSSVLNILTGLYILNEGDLFIDGEPIAARNMRFIQKRIGYITQEPVIFEGSFFENITFWDSKTPENLERFNEVLRITQLYDLVYSFDRNEDTILGSAGVTLSGGQLQRVSIARELYKDVDLLIMDEATSALDSQTESSLQQSIDALKGKLTIVIVAHRLATIKGVDTIFVLSNGQIIESGNYQELISGSKIFQDMISFQKL